MDYNKLNAFNIMHMKVNNYNATYYVLVLQFNPSLQYKITPVVMHDGGNLWWLDFGSIFKHSGRNVTPKLPWGDNL